MSEPESMVHNRSWPARAWQVLRILQVRLRFVVVLLLVFLIVGQWETITAWWRTWVGRLAGSQTEQAVSSSTEYFCPMCPGVLSAWPSQCPVCSMPLVRRTKGEMGILPDGALVRMQISPYRLQLGGIATTTIEYRELMSEADQVSLADLEPYRSQPRGVPELSAEEARKAYVCPNHPQQVSARPDRCPLDGAELVAQDLTANERLRWSCPLHTSKVSESPGEHCEHCAGLSLVPAVIAYAPARAVLAVPESAVIESDGLQIVFRKATPGVFDAVPVQLGEAAQGYHPVLSGLRPGSEVVTQGAFLLDAETRLDPDLATAYFGADVRSTNARPQGSTMRGKTKSDDLPSLLSKLNLSDQKRALALRQRTCPITKMQLGSMGAPVEVVGAGQTVLLCCEGCRKKFTELHADAGQVRQASNP